MASSETNAGLLEAFLQPLHVDVERCHELSQLFLQNFTHLAAESLDQFLPTPISESILRPVADHGHGRYVPPSKILIPTLEVLVRAGCGGQWMSCFTQAQPSRLKAQR